MNKDQKLEFLLNTYPLLLRKLDASTLPVFGKMNVLQMIEHMSDSVRIANGKKVHTVILTPEDKVAQLQHFIRSEKEFRPNTKNVLMKEEPEEVKSAGKEAAIAELEEELKSWVKHFEGIPEKVQRNPFFGDLDFELWTLLLYKHAIHHLKQFGVDVMHTS